MSGLVDGGATEHNFSHHTFSSSSLASSSSLPFATPGPCELDLGHGSFGSGGGSLPMMAVPCNDGQTSTSCDGCFGPITTDPLAASSGGPPAWPPFPTHPSYFSQHPLPLPPPPPPPPHLAQHPEDCDVTTANDDLEEEEEEENGDDGADIGKSHPNSAPPKTSSSSSSSSLVKRRRRTNMSREERKSEDIQNITAFIAQSLNSLGDSLNKSAGEYVYYPYSAPGCLTQSREFLHQYLPVGTPIDVASLRRIRDPHVHYTFFRSQVLFVSTEIEKTLANLQRYLVYQINQYRYRLCNNCRKTWGGTYNLQKSPLSPYQESLLQNSNNTSSSSPTHPSLSASVLASISSSLPIVSVKPHPTSVTLTAPAPATAVAPPLPLPLPVGAPSLASSVSSSFSATATTTSSWTSDMASLIVPAITKNGLPDLALRERGVFSVVQPKRNRRQNKKKKSEHEELESDPRKESTKKRRLANVDNPELEPNKKESRKKRRDEEGAEHRGGFLADVFGKDA